MDARLIDDAVEALRAGKPVVLPTDTVYGLCSSPERPGTLAELKGRETGQPIALLAASVDGLLSLMPELDERLLRPVLPGALTLVVPNPERRYPGLTGESPEKIGIRVPELGVDAREIVRRLGAVAATSANLHGGPDPRRLEDVPEEISSAAIVVDGGELPGTPSTVLDLTGPEPVVLREGAVPAAEALARIARLD